MEAKNYQQCKRCVMDTTDVDITFDEKGFCNHCTNFFNITLPRICTDKDNKTELENIIKNIKKSGINNKYDCVIGISGGIDSSYVAYYLKKMGLRALLVHLDNTWNSEIAESNIKKLAEKLDYDYINYTLDADEYKDLQLTFLKASVPEIETPTDIAILSVLHIVAAQHNIRYIISGGNFSTEGILPKTWHYNAKDLKYFKNIQKKFGTVKIKKFPFFGWQNELYYKFIKKIKMVYLLNCIPYKKEDAMREIENELDWKYYGGKHYESKFTGFVQSFILPKKFNIDYRKATLSTLICSGQIQREEALKILEKPPYNNETIEDEINYFCKKLDISSDTFNKMLEAEPKLYRDYPNDDKKLELIYNVYRKLFKKPNYK